MTKKKELSSEEIKKQLFKEHEDAQDYIPPTEEIIHVFKGIPKYREVVFTNGRDPGCPLEFFVHTATHPYKKYSLLHGYVYNLPEEIIEHVESLAIPIYGKVEVDGIMRSDQVTGHKFLYSFRTPSTPARR